MSIEDSDNFNDIGLIKINTVSGRGKRYNVLNNVGIAELPTIADGRLNRVWGYTAGTEDWTQFIAKRGDWCKLHAAKVGELDGSLFTRTYKDVTCILGENHEQFRSGDSGGPIFTRSNDKLVVVGITSIGLRTIQDKAQPSKDLNGILRTLPHLAWIRQTIKTRSNRGSENSDDAQNAENENDILYHYENYDEDN